MQLQDLPYELVSKILEEVAEANIRAGPTYTFGLSQAPMPLQTSPIQRYVKGPVLPQTLKWDASCAVRNVCWRWHEWALQYALKAVYVRRWKGGERWVELSNRRSSYPLYELIDRPTGTAVYRDPLASIKQAARILNDFPKLASKVKRMWFHGFYTVETNRMIFDALKNCSNLVALSVPWTMIRHLDAQSWRALLIGDGFPLESLELQCIDPTSQEATEKDSQVDLHAIQSVDFGQLRRLKVFGDTNCMPITDDDLFTISRTATQLEEFHMTCISTITIDGVMAVVKASRNTLRVLEHSPRSQEGFWHPHPGKTSDSEHPCETLRSCPKLETLSISLPSVCADLFSYEDAMFRGDMQVRTLHLCGYETSRSTQEVAEALRKLLQGARGLMHRRAKGFIARGLYVEMFFADCIFEPGSSSVHGDFNLAQAITHNRWPAHVECSGKGPYGSTGLYERQKERPFQRIDEDDFLVGVGNGLHPVFI